MTLLLLSTSSKSRLQSNKPCSALPLLFSTRSRVERVTLMLSRVSSRPVYCCALALTDRHRFPQSSTLDTPMPTLQQIKLLFTLVSCSYLSPRVDLRYSSLMLPRFYSCQTNELGSEYRKNSGPFVSIAPVYTSGQPGRSPTGASESGSNASNTSTSAFQSTFKTLAHPSAISDNVFDELETRRPTSWQFELHQRKSHSSIEVAHSPSS